MRPILTLLALPSLTLCAACALTVQGPNARCSELIPPTWKEPVEGAAVPEGTGLADWMAAFVAAAGQLEKANGRTADTIGIVERCETMVNDTRK